MEGRINFKLRGNYHHMGLNVWHTFKVSMSCRPSV